MSVLKLGKHYVSFIMMIEKSKVDTIWNIDTGKSKMDVKLTELNRK